MNWRDAGLRCLSFIFDIYLTSSFREEDYYIIDHREEQEELDISTIPPNQLKIYKAVLLSIAFTASIGGTGTLIGTGSNVVLSGYLQQ